MMLIFFFASLAAAIPLAPNACPAATGGPKYAPPIVAKGYKARVLINNLTRPRSIIFDADGNMLVMQNRVEITAFKMKTDNNCVTTTGKQTVVKASVGPGENVGATHSNLTKY
jgi:glucose/arabinose dehydrogenase